MIVYEWAKQWCIPYPAVTDLLKRMGAVSTDAPVRNGASEAAVQSRERLAASKRGARLWRNNTGVAQGQDGRPVRYGLCNDSAQLNRRLKSSDLIGITPVLITPAHVGGVIGQFTALEAKREGWVFTGTEHEKAQLRFLELVISLGGSAAFTTGGGL